jgi:hypothetical protein
VTWALLTSRLGILTGAGIALFIAVLMWKAERARADLADMQLEQAEATITELSLDLQITQAASAERAEDEQEIDEQRRELNDATFHAGDSPVDRGLRHLCVLRRQQGSIDGLPSQCRRFDDEAGAAGS